MGARKGIFLPAVGVWLLLAGVGILNGTFRDAILEPNLGRRRRRP